MNLKLILAFLTKLTTFSHKHPSLACARCALRVCALCVCACAPTRGVYVKKWLEWLGIGKN